MNRNLPDVTTMTTSIRHRLSRNTRTGSYREYIRINNNQAPLGAIKRQQSKK